MSSVSLKVILDLSWLGARYNQDKGGLSRSIENLGLRLARHPGCEVRFSAFQSRSVANKTQRYLKHHPPLENNLLIGHPTIQSLHRTLETQLMAMNASASRDIGFRAFRKVVHWGVISFILPITRCQK